MKTLLALLALFLALVAWIPVAPGWAALTPEPQRQGILTDDVPSPAIQWIAEGEEGGDGDDCEDEDDFCGEIPEE